MSGYSVSRQARHELKEIWKYVANANRPAADRLLANFEETFRFLAAQPYAGERRLDLGDIEYRVFSAGSYVIFYRLRGRKVVIAHVRHGARDLDDLV